jgi:hypothetical protein
MFELRSKKNIFVILVPALKGKYSVKINQDIKKFEIENVSS